MAWFFQLLAEGVVLPQPPITPLPETGGQEVTEILTPTPYVNALVVVGVMFAGSLAMIVLMKYRRFIRVLLSAIFFTATWAATTFYIILGTQLQENAVFITSALVASLVTAGVFSKSELAAVLGASYLSSASGVIIGSSIPFWTSLILLVAISLYDLLAVFKGHLKRIADADTSSIRGLLVDFRGVTIGLGDLFFYSVLLSFSISNFGVVSGAAAYAGLLGGFIATLHLAKKRRIFPGLPLTLTVALAASLLTYWLV
jgi:presenilin-like A22 family membrane protease